MHGVLQLTRSAALMLPVLLLSCAPRAVEYSALTLQDGLAYLEGSEAPYSGLATKFDRDGSLRARVHLRDGRFHGDFVCFFRNGRAQFVAHMASGRPVGRAIHYWSNGQVMWEATFVDGILDGPVAAWYLRGQPQVEGHCAGGSPDGAWVQYYEAGTQHWSVTFADGHLIGKLLSWYPGDRPRLQGEINATGDGSYALYDYEGRCYERGSIDDWAVVNVTGDSPIPTRSLRRFTAFAEQWIRLLEDPIPFDVALETRPPN